MFLVNFRYGISINKEIDLIKNILMYQLIANQFHNYYI